MKDTETSLMLDLSKGSLKAFDRIYELYARKLYAYCFQCTQSRQITEEIVQDVFVNLWRYHADIDPQRSLSTLLFTIARRYRINAFRSIVNSPVYEDYLDYRDTIASESHPGIEYTEFLADIHTALAQTSRPTTADNNPVKVQESEQFRNRATAEYKRKDSQKPAVGRPESIARRTTPYSAAHNHSVALDIKQSSFHQQFKIQRQHKDGYHVRQIPCRAA